MRSSRRAWLAMLGLVAVPFLAGGCETTVVFDVGEPFAAGFSLTWQTVDDADGAPIDCTGVGATDVRVQAHNLDTDEEFVDLFPCEDEAGTTADVTAGNYEILVELIACDRGGDPTCASATALTGVALPPAGQAPYPAFDEDALDIGDFTFPIVVGGSFTANVAWDRDATGPGTLCDNAAGGSVVKTAFLLAMDGSTISEVPFNASTDINAIGGIDCTETIVFGQDTPIDFGTYQLEIQGVDFEATLCWDSGPVVISFNQDQQEFAVDAILQSGCPY